MRRSLWVGALLGVLAFGCQTPVPGDNLPKESTEEPPLVGEPTALEASPVGGRLLTVTSQSHLRSDRTYDDGSLLRTFRADGTYEVLSYTKNLDGSTVVTSGSRGTYRYNPSTYLLTTRSASYRNETGAWIALTGAYPGETVETVALLEHAWLRAHVATGDPTIWETARTDTLGPSTQYRWRTMVTLDLEHGQYRNDYREETLVQGAWRLDYQCLGESPISGTVPESAAFTQGDSRRFDLSGVVTTRTNWDEAGQVKGTPEVTSAAPSHGDYSHLGGALVQTPQR